MKTVIAILVCVCLATVMKADQETWDDGAEEVSGEPVDSGIDSEGGEWNPSHVGAFHPERHRKYSQTSHLVKNQDKEARVKACLDCNVKPNEEWLFEEGEETHLGEKHEWAMFMWAWCTSMYCPETLKGKTYKDQCHIVNRTTPRKWAKTFFRLNKLRWGDETFNLTFKPAIYADNSKNFEILCYGRQLFPKYDNEQKNPAEERRASGTSKSELVVLAPLQPDEDRTVPQFPLDTYFKNDGFTVALTWKVGPLTETLLPDHAVANSPGQEPS